MAAIRPVDAAGRSNCKALPTCMGGCPWESERLTRVHRGECDTFRFFPKKVVQLAHVRMRTRGEVQPEVARAK